MLQYRVALGLVGSMITIGCGRFGFTHAGDEHTALGDDGPCIESSLQVSENSMRAYEPRLVWNGTKAGVAWMEDPIPDAVHFRTISLDGTADPIASPGVLAQGEAVDAAWDGASWRLTWADDDPNREIMTSTDGAAPRALTTNQRQDMRARVVPMSGGRTAYLWVTNQTNQTTYDLRLTVIDAAGTTLVNELAVVTGGGSELLQAHQLAWTGSELVVFYPTSKNLMMLRLNPDGSRIAAPATVGTISTSFIFASASWIGDRFLVSWNSAAGLRIAYVDVNGALLFPAVGAAGSTQWTNEVSVAIGATSDAVAWGDINGASFLQEMSRDGTLGELHTFDNAYYPSVAWVGKRWAVALSQRVDPTPANPDSKPDYINLIQICSAAAN